MDPALFGRALVAGFAFAAAVGPISVLTMRRTLLHGRLYGLASGIGVALADATYAAIAAFGITALTSVLVGGRAALGLVGGVVIVWLAIRTLTSRPPAVGADGETATRPGLLGAAVSIYGLTMTNPMTILSFVVVFAALGLAGEGGIGALTATIGIFVGSALWWVVLTTGIGWLRARITPTGLLWINRGSGVILLAFGIVAIGGTLTGAA
jgi:threonine/homoserine/homoserine lactone efflux protein